MKFLFTLLTFISISAVSFGQDAKADEILDKLSKKMKSHTSFYIEFASTIKNSSTGTNESLTGKGWVKDKKYYASFGDNTIISNGIKTWTVVKEEKMTYVSDADEDDDSAINPKKLMTIWETGFKTKYAKETTIEGDPVHVIYLHPKDLGSVDYHTIVLYISKAKNELKKVTVKGKDGTSMMYRVTKYTANPTIEDAKFVYDPKKYPGYKLLED